MTRRLSNPATSDNGEEDGGIRRSFIRRASNPALNEDAIETLATRIPTVEGFSLYHAGSAMGPRVATLQAGTLTGEIALLHDQSRTASLKCLQDTSFIIIGKLEFESVLKAEMQRAREEKVNFLLNHLPGLRDIPVMRHGGRPHPSYYFKKVTVAKGHEFLKQGQVAEDAVHVVFNGSVELRRRIRKDAQPQRQMRGTLQANAAAQLQKVCLPVQ